MTAFLEIVEMVLPVLVMIGLGFLCNKRRLFDEKGLAGLKALIGDITLPVVLFNAFLSAQYNLRLVVVFAVLYVVSGAALADIGALGGTQIKQMRDRGYSDEFATGITMAAATIGPIFPPSIPLIIFAAAAEVSAVKLLLAGAVPAIVLAIFLMAQVSVMARRQNLPADTTPFDWGDQP